MIVVQTYKSKVHKKSEQSQNIFGKYSTYKSLKKGAKSRKTLLKNGRNFYRILWVYEPEKVKEVDL